MSRTAQKHYFAGLVGKTIKHVAYLDKGQIEEDFGWYCDEDETTVIVFTDGTAAILMADPEGNELCLVQPLPPELARPRWGDQAI